MIPLPTPFTPGRARIAFLGLTGFVLLLYSNPVHWFPELPDLAYAKVAGALALGSLLVSALLYHRRLHGGGPVGLLLLLLFVWLGTSAAWSLWPSMSLDTFADGLKYLAIFWLVANVVDSPRRAVRLVHLIALASLIPAEGAISSWWRGEHLVEGDRAGWVGIFANPNDLAHYLVIGTAFSLGGREIARARWLRWAYLPVLVVQASAIFLTQSRGGLFAATTVIALWTLRGASEWSKRGRIAVALATTLGIALQIAPETTFRRTGQFDYAEDASVRGRLDAWRTGLAIARDRPLTGVGAGAFPLAWPEFAPGDAGPPRTAHNTFIQLVGETGFPALLLFVSALLLAALRLRTAVRRPSPIGPLARATGVALAGFVVCSLTGGYAYSWPLYLVLGLAVGLARMETF